MNTKFKLTILAAAMCLALAGLAACGGSGQSSSANSTQESAGAAATETAQAPSSGTAASSEFGDFSKLLGMSGQEVVDAMAAYATLEELNPTANYPNGMFASTDALIGVGETSWPTKMKPGDWAVQVQTGTFAGTKGIDYITVTLCPSALQNASTVDDVDYQSLVDELRKNIGFSEIVLYHRNGTDDYIFEGYLVLNNNLGFGTIGGFIDDGIMKIHAEPFNAEADESYVREEIDHVKNSNGGYQILYMG